MKVSEDEVVDVAGIKEIVFDGVGVKVKLCVEEAVLEPPARRGVVDSVEVAGGEMEVDAMDVGVDVDDRVGCMFRGGDVGDAVIVWELDGVGDIVKVPVGDAVCVRGLRSGRVSVAVRVDSDVGTKLTVEVELRECNLWLTTVSDGV